MDDGILSGQRHLYRARIANLRLPVSRPFSRALHRRTSDSLHPMPPGGTAIAPPPSAAEQPQTRQMLAPVPKTPAPAADGFLWRGERSDPFACARACSKVCVARCEEDESEAGLVDS